MLGLFHIALTHVAHRTGEKAASAAGRIEQDFAGVRVDAVHHEGGDGARRVVFAGVSGRLQIVEKLFVELTEMPSLVEIVEIDLVDLV